MQEIKWHTQVTAENEEKQQKQLLNKLYKKMKVKNGFPRRSCVYLLSPSEKAIYDAHQIVESLGADTRLTEATILLQQARDKVADYIDEQMSKPE